MKHDEFIGQVQHRAALGSRGDAERAAHATLETLGERLAGGEAKDLASQLPPELGDYVLSGLAGIGDRFSLDEFFQRVAIREGVSPADAAFHARAVASVLREAVSIGELSDMLAQLPDDYLRLFLTSDYVGEQ
jgi:uncharacterized protein (DUF2267 family)